MIPPFCILYHICFLFLRLPAFTSDVPSYTIILLTPPLYLDPSLLNYLSISSAPTLSPLGQRQAYITGRELRKIYVEQKMLLSGESSEEIETRADSNLLHSQTLTEILRGLLISGSVLQGKSLQKRAVPPGNFSEFANWSTELRDAAMPHYTDPASTKSILAENDTFFRAEDVCPSFKAKALARSKQNSCAANDSTTAACRELYSVCKGDANFTANSTDSTLCSCYSMIFSAQAHEISEFMDVNKTAIKFGGDVCDEYVQDLFASAHSSVQIKLVTQELVHEIAAGMRRHMVHREGKVALYVLSEFQMKAVLFALTQEYPAKMPAYASMTTIELYRDFDNQTEGVIKLRINKKKAEIYGNEEDISYSEFVRIVEENSLPNYYDACFPVSEPAEESSSFPIWIPLVAGAGAFLLISGIFIFCYRRHKHEPENEEERHEDKKESILSGEPEVEHVAPEEVEYENPTLHINRSGHDLHGMHNS